MEAGRNVDVASQLLKSMDVPYVVASPLLLQSIPMWKSNGVLGLQSVVLYSLPELDGAIDTVVLGGLVGDKVCLLMIYNNVLLFFKAFSLFSLCRNFHV